MQTAGIRLLGLTEHEIRQHAEEIIVTQLDRLAEAIDAGQVNPATDDLVARLEKPVETGLNQLGLVLINIRRE